jgi:hypothetical protein
MMKPARRVEDQREPLAIDAATTHESRKRKALDTASVRYHGATIAAKGKGTKVPPGCLVNIIQTVLHESKLDIDEPTFQISK